MSSPRTPGRFSKPLPVAVSVRTQDGEKPIAESKGWRLDVARARWSGPGEEVHLRATWEGAAPTTAALVVHRDVKGQGQVLVPSLFYADNGDQSSSMKTRFT